MNPLTLRAWERATACAPPVDVARRVEPALDHVFAGCPLPGRRVAVGVGSRALPDHAALVAAVCSALRQRGARPLVVPAMGSHGGDAPGQLAILARQGIDAESVAAAIDADMTTQRLGETSTGATVHWSASALAADFTLLVNRVAEHPRLLGPVQSGLIKMSVIGLGKKVGAHALHAAGLEQHLAAAGALVRQHTNLCGGLALLCGEDAMPSDLVGVRAAELPDAEASLLSRARSLRPRLPFAELDVLLVDWLGKDIAPTGIDRRVVGRMPGGDPVRIGALIALGLSPASAGNGLGVGIADAITQRVLDGIDRDEMQHNLAASGDIEACTARRVFDSDRAALEWGLGGLGQRLARIESTARMRRVFCSEGLEPPGYQRGALVTFTYDVAGQLDREAPWRRTTSPSAKSGS